MPYCKNCGILMEGNYCKECGQPIDRKTASPTYTPQNITTYNQQSSGLATASIVLGIVGCCLGWLIPLIGIILGIIGIVLGGVAIVKKQKNGLAGFILSILSLVLAIIFWIIWAGILLSMYS